MGGGKGRAARLGLTLYSQPSYYIVMLSPLLTDYSAIIREEIERTVKDMRKEFDKRRAYPVHRDVFLPFTDAKGVKLGHLINTHHGLPLYKNGDTIDGLPVTIDNSLSRIIKVYAEDVFVSASL